MAYWREYFAPWILERGYDYYLNDHVTTVEEDESGYGFTGIVSGSEDYSVQVCNINSPFDDELYMHCTCPYADSGSNCKHMAALLYAIEVNEANDSNAYRSDKNISINSDKNSLEILSETLNSLPREVIKSELEKILASDESLRTGFLVKYNRNESSIADYLTLP